MKMERCNQHRLKGYTSLLRRLYLFEWPLFYKKLYVLPPHWQSKKDILDSLPMPQFF